MPNLEALLRVPHVDPDYGFDLSPEGAAFAYNLSGQWEIYTLPLDGSSPPRQVTEGPGAKFAPRWSPGPAGRRRLAYALDLEGGEDFDLWLYDPASGRHTNLTPNTPDAIQPNYAWSPGEGAGEPRIALLSNRAGHFDTYVVPAAGGEPRLVYGSPRPDWEVHWSPAGRYLAVTSEAGGQDHETCVVPVEGGLAVPVGQAGKALPAKDAAWAPRPGDPRLVFASNLTGRYNLGLYDRVADRVEWLTAGEGDKEQPAWSPDGKRLAYVRSDGPLTALVVLDLETGQEAVYRVADGVHYRPHFTPDGQALVFVFDNPGHPADLWRLSLADGSFRQLTHSLPSELVSYPFVQPGLVSYPSLDGTQVPALLYRPPSPPSGGLPPGVVYVHGGPNWLTQVTWDPRVQHMVGRGWTVLAPNYRGSTGYGRAWQLANRFDLGGGDTWDVVAGADYLAGEGLADPARIAITGRSYGGYLTMTSLTGYPDRFAAGSAVVPFLNWFTGHANSREDLQHWDLENFGHPERDRDLYRERSPFFFLDRVVAPVQLISGAHDPRCPASESVQAHQALLAQGKACDLALYPDEGHSFLKTENVVDAEKRRIAFLAGVLEGKGYASSKKSSG